MVLQKSINFRIKKYKIHQFIKKLLQRIVMMFYVGVADFPTNYQIFPYYQHWMGQLSPTKYLE